MTGRGDGALKRAAALAVGAAVAGSLALAGPSFAAPPSAGSNCQPDGKITGRGATFQANAQNLVFAQGFQNDVCGAVANAAGNSTEFGTKMVLYNYAAAATHAPVLTGSGSGITGARCRTDAFNGSDVPYTQAQLTTLRGAVPTTADTDCAGYNDAGNPFAPPAPAFATPFPNNSGATGDQQASPMSFPVAAGAVAIGVNLPASACGGTAPSAIQLSTSNASRLWGGQILNWNDAALVADNPGLAACTGAVRRFVRSDNSGTTTIFKNYLNHADGTRALCDGTTWSGRLGQGGNNFPNGGSCSPVTAVSGNPAVVNNTAATANAVGYGDLSDWLSLAPNAVLADVAPSTGGGFVSPASGVGSNCAFTGSYPQLPTGTAANAVGLNSNVALTWASDSLTGSGTAARARGDATFQGTGYPICGLTWALVYSGLNHNGSSATAISRLNDNQRRTLYAYFTYILSPTAQLQLSNQGFAPIRSSWLNTLRSGFQGSF